MAKLNLYVIFDKVAEESGPPFTAVNDGVAQRNYQQLMRNVPDNQRSEYALFILGTYDPFLMKVEQDLNPIEVETSPLDFSLDDLKLEVVK